MTEKIGLTLPESTPAPQADPYRRGAPNVVLVMFDDLGFGQVGCYGGPIDTPNIDRLAEGGLRYTNFHTTAVCAPTRASMLTGRNHHRVGMGMLPDTPLAFPGYSGVIPPEAATIPAILREEGWATWCIGKWHLSPRDHRTPAGPFHTWPTGQGFDRYYGFTGGEASQWTPTLVRDQSFVDPPATPEEGYHFTEDIADEAIRNLRELRLHQPDRPFMLYWAPGAPHSPHQVPDAWADIYAGQFDDGWDAARERTLARQKELGVVPEHVELSDRPDWVPAWDSLGESERRLSARLQEIFAAFVTHADAQLGRIVDELETAGELDNTVFMIMSDNGASGEGGPYGSINHLGQLNNFTEDLEKIIADVDLAGGHKGYNHYPWGWAFAGNTPLRRWKRYTYEGGVRDPLIVRGPAVPGEIGGIRHQYCHAIDVLPTVLDLLGVHIPERVRSVPQMSLDGVSLVPTMEAAEAAEVRHTQYYECWGSRAIYSDGWKAVTDHVNQLNPYEREQMAGSADFRTDNWSLYNSAEDFAETHDLSTTEPDKLRELIDLWWREAGRNQVLPLDDGMIERFPHMHLPYNGLRRHYELQRGERVLDLAGPMVGGGFTAVARLHEPLGDDVGVICEQGDRIAGWSWVAFDEVVAYIVAVPSVGTYRVDAPRSADARVLGLTMRHAGDGSAEVSHLADGETIATGTIPVVPARITNTNGGFLTAGYGSGFPVSEDYSPPFALTKLDRVVIDAAPPKPERVSEIIDSVMRYQ